MKTKNKITKATTGAGLVLLLFAAVASHTTAAQAADPAIAFAAQMTTGGSTLWVMDADGSNKTQIFGAKGVYASNPSWSPDGLWLAFTATSGIYVVSKSGGPTTLLLSAVSPAALGDPAWSPLGDRIAYDWADSSAGGESSVRVIPAGGGTPQVLYQFSPPWHKLGGAFSWAPDATKLTVEVWDDSTRTSFLGILDVASGTIQDATRPNGFDWVDGSKADWARHSNRIAFCGHKVGEQVFLWILDLDTMNFSKILGPIQYGNAQPSWSPDDSKLVFRKPGGLSYKNELWTLDLNTGVQTFLAEVGKQQNDLYEPDWRRFLKTGLHLGTAMVTTITSFGNNPDWSP